MPEITINQTPVNSIKDSYHDKNNKEGSSERAEVCVEEGGRLFLQKNYAITNFSEPIQSII